MSRRGRTSTAALGLSILAVGLGCAEDHPVTERESADKGRPGPMCLEPPWTPRDGEDGLRNVACAREQEFGVVLPGGRPPTEALSLQFLEQHRQAIHAIDGVESSGYGVCCEGAWSSPDVHCIVIGLRLCSTTASDLFEELTTLQGSSAASAGVALKVSVGLVGLLGARCKPEECGPVPYRETNANAPPIERKLVEAPERAATCEHDGECVAAGCGNQCDHWSEVASFGTCEGRPELEEAFCGCVEQQCSWFE